MPSSRRRGQQGRAEIGGEYSMGRFGNAMLGVLLACAALPARAEDIGTLRLIGEAALPKDLDYQGTTVGGL
jgi:hypothetical protein